MKEIGMEDIAEFCCLADDVLDEMRFHVDKTPAGQEDFTIYNLIKNPPYSLTELVELSVPRILECHLDPYMEAVRGLFRDRVCDYIPSSDVPDAYLDAIFAQRVKDRMLIFCVQKGK